MRGGIYIRLTAIVNLREASIAPLALNEARRRFHRGTTPQKASSLSHYPPPPSIRRDGADQIRVEILLGEVVFFRLDMVP
jgi:hypothetical protein